METLKGYLLEFTVIGLFIAGMFVAGDVLFFFVRAAWRVFEMIFG